MKLDDKNVDEFLTAAATGSAHVSDDEYQQIFEGQGKREYIINYLQKLSDEGANLEDYCYLAVGAADGSEPMEVLDRTPINVSAMIEISDAGAQLARNNAGKLPDDKHLNVLQGDVMDRIADVGEWVKQEHPQISGVVLSLQAVLHELPNRCRSFDFDEFLANAFSPFENCIFLAGEPVQASNWPELVEISIENVSAKKLAKAAEYVRNHLRFDDIKIIPMHGGWVKMESTLALEVLHKLITQFNSKEIISTIGKHLPSASIKYKERTSDGFLAAYKEAGVQARHVDGKPLDPPLTHARFQTLLTDDFNSKKIEPKDSQNITHHGWTLEGKNPEPGKETNVYFQLTPEELERKGGEITLGRKSDAADLVIDNTSVSKSHAILAQKDSKLTVRDNSSSNGTKVNGKTLSSGQSHQLSAGDQLQIGEVTVSISQK